VNGDFDAAGGRLERRLRHDPDLVVDLDRLGTGVAQLLDAVEQEVHAEVRVGHGHRDPHARPVRGERSGEHAQRGELGTRLLQRGNRLRVVVLQPVAGRLELTDVLLGATRRGLESRERLDQVCLAEAGEVVVATGDAHLRHCCGAQDSEQHRDHHLTTARVEESPHQALSNDVVLGHARLIVMLTRGRDVGGWPPRSRRS
jgi:hypothetical protein